MREPEPLASDGTLIFPDFALQARVAKLILCIDEARNCARADLPPGALVVRFRRRVDPGLVLRAIGGAELPVPD